MKDLDAVLLKLLDNGSLTSTFSKELLTTLLSSLRSSEDKVILKLNNFSATLLLFHCNLLPECWAQFLIGNLCTQQCCTISTFSTFVRSIRIFISELSSYQSWSALSTAWCALGIVTWYFSGYGRHRDRGRREHDWRGQSLTNFMFPWSAKFPFWLMHSLKCIK